MMKYILVILSLCVALLCYTHVTEANVRKTLDFQNKRFSRGRNTNKDSEPSSDSDQQSGGEHVSYFDSRIKKESKIDKGCKDCDEIEEKRSTAPKRGTVRSSAHPKAFIRVRVFPRGKNPFQGRRWQEDNLERLVRPNPHSSRSWGFGNKLGMREKQRGHNRQTLARRTYSKQKQSKFRYQEALHDQTVNFDKVKSSARQAQSIKKTSNILPEEKSLILKAARERINRPARHFNPEKRHKASEFPSDETRSHRTVSADETESLEKVPQDEARQKANTDLSDWSAGHYQSDEGNKLVRPELADRLESSGPTLLQSVHKLRRHANAMLQAFRASRLELDNYYKIIFNGTRYIIPYGVRDALEGIHAANDDILKGMTEAYRVRGKQMLKQFMIKDERGRGFPHDEPRTPEEHENEALRILKEIESRDIHQQLELMKNKEDEMFAFSASIIELERKCLQEKTNINRVRKRLRSRRNLAFQELLDYLTSAVLTMNTGFLYTPSMRLLSFIKRSMDHTYRNLKSGSETIQKTYRSLENTRSSIERNRALIQEWLAKKQKTKQKRMDSHQHRPSRFTSGVVSPEDLGLLNLKVMASDIHSRSLKDRTQRQLSVLVKSLQDAETFLSRPTGSKVVFAQIEPLKQDLQKFTPDMYTLLEEIGNLTGSQVKLKPFKRCMPIQVIEGSGDGEENEVVVGENPGCDGNDIDNMTSSGDGEVKEIVTKDKSSGGGGLFGNFDWWSSNNENEENTNDFTFEEEPELLLNSTVRPQALTLHRTQGLQEWNRDTKSFTKEMLQASQELYNEARVVNTSLADLHQSWKQIQNEVSDLERMVDNQKKMNENMTAKAIVFLDIRGEINKFQPPSLLNLGASLRIARTIERRIQPETMGTEPAQNTQAGWLDDYYDYYDSNYYYEDIVGTKPLTELVQRDATDIDYTELSRMGRQIEDNSNDIHRLRTLSLGTCGRVGSHLGSIHRNLTALREKVNEARDMLNALQLSISKSGKGHIAVSIPSDVKEMSNDMTIIRLCMKPATLDGPIILMKGNDSASYSVFLDEGLLSVSLYDAEWSSLKKVQVDSVLQKDVWYTIQIKRLGLFLNVSLQQQGQEKMVKSEHIGLANLDSFESRPERVYLGGVPNDINVVDGFWEGCIGDVAVNGRTLNIFRPDSESAGPSLCDSHCLTKKERLSTIFNGDGFLHYNMSTRDVFTSIELSFSTHQDTASLFSYVNGVKGVYLNLLLERSALRVQSTSSKESLVYLSSDKAFSDGKPHRVKIEYEDSAARISIDGVKGDVQVQTRKPNVEKDSLQGLVIGAFVTDERQFSKDNKFRPFIGCIQDLSVNGESLPFSQAKDMYNVYEGYCTDALENRWHSCRRWGEESSSLVLDEVPQSNIVSLWVSSNATGPVMRYARKDDFSAVITLTLEGLVANIGDSSIPLSRPEEDKSRDMFSLTVVDKPDEKNLLVLAWGQTMEHSYGYTGWFFGGSADPTKPHSLVIAGSGETGSDVEGEDNVQKFAGSLSRFTIENRFVDLNQFEFKHKLLACERPLKNVRPIVEGKTLPVPQITCS